MRLGCVGKDLDLHHIFVSIYHVPVCVNCCHWHFTCWMSFPSFTHFFPILIAGLSLYGNVHTSSNSSALDSFPSVNCCHFLYNATHHSLKLSSQLFLYVPCLLPPFTVPCKLVLARPNEGETCPYHRSLRLCTMVRKSSCGPTACWILAHQGMDGPGVRQVPEGSGEQGNMEETGCEIIGGAPTTLVVKG